MADKEINTKEKDNDVIVTTENEKIDNKKEITQEPLQEVNIDGVTSENNSEGPTEELKKEPEIIEAVTEAMNVVTTVKTKNRFVDEADGI